MIRPDPVQLLADLRDEGQELETLLDQLPEQDWDLSTPADGWSIRHQVAHLAWTDEILLTALKDSRTFDEVRVQLAQDPGLVDRSAREATKQLPAEILETWRSGKNRVLAALGAVPPGGRIPWIGPPMGVAMMASARIMETFAHGQDIRDGLGRPPVPSHRLRHIAHLAVAARDYTFQQRHRRPPGEPFHVDLTHGDESWTWGPPEAAQCVYGDALDFALLATRRRHRADCAVTADGPEAQEWLDIVQAYAGPPGPGRNPLSSSGTHR